MTTAITVAELQQRLNTYNGTSLLTDGKAGPRTEAVLRATQKRLGAPGTGVIDDATMVALDAAILAQSRIPDLITPEQLVAIAGIPSTVAARWARPLSIAFHEYGVDTPARIGAFIANAVHECGGFQKLEENLNYSAKRLSEVWPNRYAVNGVKGVPNELARSIGGKPILIANQSYNGRMGNRPNTNDGWNYRGRGVLGVTGADNYRIRGEAIGLPLLEEPDYLLLPLPAARASCEFWRAEKINRYADIFDFDGTSDEVNRGHKTEKEGDAIGWADRLKYYRKAREVLKF